MRGTASGRVQPYRCRSRRCRASAHELVWCPRCCNELARSGAERNAINAPIQGSAADIIKIAMIRVHEKFKEQSLKSKMLLQVHDELIFEMPFEELKNVPYEIAKIMEIAHEPMIELKVPMKADIGIGENWSEAH